jgi:hypothetical protein
MGYGLRVRDSSGNIVLDTSNTITRFRYSNEVSAGVSNSEVLSDIDGLDSVEFSIMTETIYNLCPHQVNRSGTTISWTASGIIGSSNSLIFSFLYT